MTTSLRVVIVEDDAVISRVYATLIRAMPHFTVVGTARTAASGWTSIDTLQPHLVLLDYGLPGGASGVDLLRRIRAEGRRVEVIAITAHSSTDLVRESMRLGVVDYLVKPFTEDRLRQVLSKCVSIFAQATSTALTQEDVDRTRKLVAPAKPYIPAELSADKLDTVRGVLRAAAGPLSAEDVANRIDSSRVTARRYLEFLVSLHEVDVDHAADKPGRPRKLYVARARHGEK
ncbi:response regulator [Actinomadura physcomitrii]|nr:response regulator [Actinomadura physcomitrii]